jgi:phenylacetate-CoA ligase
VLEALRSTIAGATWPAVPNAGGAAILAALFQLERSQWLTAPQLWRLQQRQLAALLQHAATTCPFYAGSVGRFLSKYSDAFTLEQFATLPLLTRREVQTRFAELSSARVPAQHGAVQKGSSSGSTGEPVSYLSTDLTGFFWQAFSLREHLWHRRDFSSKLAVVRSGEKSDSMANWFGAIGEATLLTGPCATIPMGSSIEVQADEVVRENPAYLTGYVNNLVAILKAIRAKGASLPALKQIRTLGEAVTQASREYVAEQWGVPLIDVYSAREAGYIALQCPDAEGYHVQAEGILVEILDKGGLPCRAGETGQVVVTPLHNFAFPLIRYALGDYAEVGAPCRCGRGLPVIRRILGRSRNLMKLPDGTTRWPVFNIPKFRSIAPIRQFQFVQRSFEELELRLAVERPLTEEEQVRFGRHVLEQVGHPFRLKWTFLSEISLSRSGKFEDFYCDFE